MERTASDLKKLIESRYYPEAKTATQKLDLLMLAGNITNEQYSKLCELIKVTYDSSNAEQQGKQTGKKKFWKGWGRWQL